jgi:hypothetical protein
VTANLPGAKSGKRIGKPSSTAVRNAVQINKPNSFGAIKKNALRRQNKFKEAEFILPSAAKNAVQINDLTMW